MEELQRQHKPVFQIGFLNAMVDGCSETAMSKISWMIG